MTLARGAGPVAGFAILDRLSTLDAPRQTPHVLRLTPHELRERERLTVHDPFDLVGCPPGRFRVTRTRGFVWIVGTWGVHVRVHVARGR